MTLVAGFRHCSLFRTAASSFVFGWSWCPSSCLFHCCGIWLQNWRCPHFQGQSLLCFIVWVKCPYIFPVRRKACWFICLVMTFRGKNHVFNSTCHSHLWFMFVSYLSCSFKLLFNVSPYFLYPLLFSSFEPGPMPGSRLPPKNALQLVSFTLMAPSVFISEMQLIQESRGIQLKFKEV